MWFDHLWGEEGRWRGTQAGCNGCNDPPHTLHLPHFQLTSGSFPESTYPSIKIKDRCSFLKTQGISLRLHPLGLASLSQSSGFNFPILGLSWWWWGTETVHKVWNASRKGRYCNAKVECCVEGGSSSLFTQGKVFCAICVKYVCNMQYGLGNFYFCLCFCICTFILSFVFS